MRRSFSILECFILLALVSAAATVAIPRWASDRIVTNEQRAAVMLREIAAAQAAFHLRNGTYGLLEDLTGDPSSRGLKVDPACLEAPTPWLGAAEFNGYLFSVYLPTKQGHGALSHVEVDPEAGAKAWVAYAWPVHYGITGRRVLVVTPAGEVFAYENAVMPFTTRERRPFAELAWAKLDPKTPFEEPGGWVTQVRWDPVADSR